MSTPHRSTVGTDDRGGFRASGEDQAMFSDILIVVDIAREHHAELVREAELQRLANRAREATVRGQRAADSTHAGSLAAGPPSTQPARHPTRPALAR